jgi:transposase
MARQSSAGARIASAVTPCIKSLAWEAIEAAGAYVLYLPSYSPDLNPIEMAFSKLKALLRKAAELTIPGLIRLIGRLLKKFSPEECRNFLSHAGYA